MQCAVSIDAPARVSLSLTDLYPSANPIPGRNVPATQRRHALRL